MLTKASRSLFDVAHRVGEIGHHCHEICICINRNLFALRAAYPCFIVESSVVVAHVPTLFGLPCGDPSPSGPSLMIFATCSTGVMSSSSSIINDGVPTWRCSHFSHDVKCGNALSFVPFVLSQIREMEVLWVNVCREGVVGGSEELVM